MEIINNCYEIDNLSYALDKYFDENTIFFDIECTGLSPRKSYIYMIGYALRLGNKITITQLLAENEAAEIEVINEFEKVISKYDKLLGFNSTRFDESFILERCRKYKISTQIKSKKHTDMYLTVTKAKCLLNLPNYKQKTIEEFLGLHREDKFNGGELIPVYQHYSLTGDEESKSLVLLHNFEDIKGMIFISDILCYSDLLNSDIRYLSNENDEEKIRIELETDISLPSSINKIREYGMYIIKENRIYVTLNLYHGSLYTFLPDYKNYYYLINEEIIIPKSLGESMDKSLRRPATRKDCKVSAEGSYVALPHGIDVGNLRTFKETYDSKESFISVEDVTPTLMVKIARYMLKH